LNGSAQQYIGSAQHHGCPIPASQHAGSPGAKQHPGSAGSLQHHGSSAASQHHGFPGVRQHPASPGLAQQVGSSAQPPPTSGVGVAVSSHGPSHADDVDPPSELPGPCVVDGSGSPVDTTNSSSAVQAPRPFAPSVHTSAASQP
jgi:hypothetical protein